MNEIKLTSILIACCIAPIISVISGYISWMGLEFVVDKFIFGKGK